MINKTWLKISMFIPIFGTSINCIILFSEYIKHKSYPYSKLMLFLLLPSVAFLVVAFLCILVIGQILYSLNVENSNIALFISFAIAGIVMNVIFLIYYKHAFLKKDATENSTDDQQ